MNQILQWLSGGDLRSDGLSNEVADAVLQQPHLLGDLMAGLNTQASVIRGRTADVLEKVARSRPDLLIDHLPSLVALVQINEVPMVKMHLAMLFGHLFMYEERTGELVTTLLALLDDESVFTVSWAIVSLCIFAKKYPLMNNQILGQIARLKLHESIAVRSKVDKAVELLTSQGASFPQGWVKSQFYE